MATCSAQYKHTPLPTQNTSRFIRILEVFPPCYRDLVHCQWARKNRSDLCRLCPDCEDHVDKNYDAPKRLNEDDLEDLDNHWVGKWSCHNYGCKLGITVRLYQESLDAARPFEALSYRWGSQSQLCELLCNGRPMLVTESCHEAMSRLRPQCNSRRSCDGFKILRRLWIDAICIDQTSVEERNHQVDLMGEIYVKAARVWMWLGYEPGEHFVLYRLALHLGSSGYSNILKLTQNPYFRRIWPVQEIALATHCHILGMTETPMRKPFTFDRLLAPFGSPGNPPNEEELRLLQTDFEPRLQPHRQLRESLKALQSSVRNQQVDESRVIQKERRQLSLGTVSGLLLTARSLQAGEPRDKVFALQGMLQIMQVPLSRPDYNKAIGDVYREAAISAIRYDRSFEILAGLTGASDVPSLPTWVPDLSNSDAISRVCEWTAGRSSGQHSTDTNLSQDTEQLQMRGALTDRVVALKVKFGNTQEAGCFENPSLQQYELQLVKFCQHFWDSNKPTWSSLPSVIRRITGSIKSDLLSRRLEDALNLIRPYLIRHLDRKVVFETDKQRIGFASEFVQLGDSVALLAGCNLPMIVRPDGDKWRMVAPAFVFGDNIMEGGLWTDDIELQDFVFV